MNKLSSPPVCHKTHLKTALKALAIGTFAWQLAVADSYAQSKQADEGNQLQNIDEGSSQYTCPMHPHYLSTDSEGTCPICGMDLVLSLIHI